MKSKRWRGATWGAVLVAAGLTASGPGVSRAQDALPGTGEHHEVTLITGDKVVLLGDEVSALVAAPGRERTVFHSYRRDGHLHVVPRDAAKAVSQGKLDPRLFDVTGLVEAGYDDRARDTLPLIVTGEQEPATAGLRVGHPLPAVGSYAAQVVKSEASDTWRTLVSRASVRKVWLDGLRQPSLDRSTAQIGAPTAWQAGHTGKGVKVAVLDTGIDQDHPDLAGHEVAERNFTDDPDNTDGVGHGTHVAATIASSGPKYRGVAPDADLLDGKVCVLTGCQESAIVAGMQWAAEQGADVVNLSLGGGDTPELDPLEEAVNTLSARTGVLFVVAAGNNSRPETVSSPGSADAALTVGAVDRQDGIAPFSSRGPRVGDGAVKPDVTAPGVDVVAAKSSSGTVGTPVADGYVAMSGTSMATPHVAGAAAVLAQQHPDWTGAQIKAALVGSAKNNPALTAFDQGAGRVDLAKAITTSLTAEPASLALGLQKWPHNDDTPVSKSVTYRNEGTAPVTLTLAAEAKGPDGGSAPTGMVGVSPAKLTVPAGGEATATVTADTRLGTADGLYVGTVAATGGATPLRTAFSVHREVESYDVRFDFVDDSGAPAADYYTSIIGLSNGTFAFPYDADGSFTLRLPKGDYFTNTDVQTDDTRLALLPRPGLTVTADTTVTLDARTARPLRITAPDPGAEEALGDVTMARAFGDRQASVSTAFLGGFGPNVSIAHVGPELAAGDLTALLGAQFRGTPDGDKPVTYRFAWSQRGKVPVGFVQDVAATDLAEVRTTFGPGPAGREYGHGGNPIAADGVSGWAWLPDVASPGESVDRVTPDPAWSWGFLQFGADGAVEATLTSPERRYERGATHRERFNDPVFSPALPESRSPYLARSGDEISFAVPLFTDRAGNGGNAAVSSARTTLLRNGTRVGETPYAANGLFPVPAGAAAYRVETDAVRAAGTSEFATQVSAAWTFRSDTTTTDEYVPLPLSVVRFTPELDAGGAAPGGQALRVPLTVQQQEGATNGRVDRIDVEVSFDDGTTWTAVPVSANIATIANPNTTGYGSVRVRATDSGGNALEHTVIRAYKIV
ncbi:subtilisin family serine protease [Saccharothrix saharensis]|uniref:Subtilisin family serine protease n=1 Tax=Saccharothrix saharensis TaxID=571190 RepID=A0A543JBD6_9PSEU|nr:S8 family serine peptidase [Saccharothrix saharensis]TQM80111.1 subtilisin family serine protease [Saccharothrix saharensis]